MPITRSAIKAMRQAETRRAQNQPVKSHMKSMIRQILTHVHAKEAEKAKKILPDVLKAIDTAKKKNLIHRSNASRKKSRVQKAVHALTAVKK